MNQPGKAAPDIDVHAVYGIDVASMDVDELKQKLLGSGTIGISVGPKPIQWTKFNDHHTVANFENIVGEFKGIDQFLEGIQGQIGLPFGNLARKMELEVAR